MSGKPSASCVCTETPFFTTSPRVRVMTSRIASLIFKVSFREGAFLMRSRIRPTTSPAPQPIPRPNGVGKRGAVALRCQLVFPNFLKNKRAYHVPAADIVLAFAGTIDDRPAQSEMRVVD